MEQDNKPEEQEEEIYFETTSQSEIIASSFYAISAVSDLDTAMMSKTEAAMVKRIMKRSLRLIDSSIKDLYEMEFDQDEEE